MYIFFVLTALLISVIPIAACDITKPVASLAIFRIKTGTLALYDNKKTLIKKLVIATPCRILLDPLYEKDLSNIVTFAPNIDVRYEQESSRPHRHKEK